MWKVVFTKKDATDAKKLKAAGLDGKDQKLIDVVRKTLLQTPPQLTKPLSEISRDTIPEESVSSIDSSILLSKVQMPMTARLATAS